MSMELMEEFLISTGKKSAIKYELKKERQEFSQIASVIQEQIEIVKNGWGYSQIEVFSDAAFLQPEQSLIQIYRKRDRSQSSYPEKGDRASLPGLSGFSLKEDQLKYLDRQSGRFFCTL